MASTDVLTTLPDRFFAAFDARLGPAMRTRGVVKDVVVTPLRLARAANLDPDSFPDAAALAAAIDVNIAQLAEGFAESITNTYDPDQTCVDEVRIDAFTVQPSTGGAVLPVALSNAPPCPNHHPPTFTTNPTATTTTWWLSVSMTALGAEKKKKGA
jgi:hypothetical protein